MSGLARTAAENPLSYISKLDDEMARLRPEVLVVPYVDPLLHGRRAMRGLVERLHAAGLLTW